MPNTKPPVRPAQQARGSAQTAAAVVRGLVSLTVLAALLAGLPVLLWWATALVGPPGLAALNSLLTSDDSGQVFLLALAVAGWVGWGMFACAVLVEVPAQLRGRAAPQIRGLVGQRAAAILVGAVLLALPTGTALAASSPAQAAPGTHAVTAAAVPRTDTAPATAAPDTGSGRAAAVTHTVRDAKPAESLWSIAASRLGDGERWSDIAALNEGRLMADGLTFHTDQPIQPGWVLQLPAGARPAAAPDQGPAPQQTGATAAGTYTVREGDSLTAVAEALLGDGDRYGEIFELNKGSVLPDGTVFTDPDVIHPGQHLALPQPETTAPTPTPVQAKPEATTKPKPSKATPSAEAIEPAPAASVPATKPAPTPGVPAQATPPTIDQTPQPVPPATAHLEAPGSRISVTLIAGIGTLLAASLASALGVRRILQQHRRQAGQTIAQDENPTELEQILATSAEPSGIELLARVLRTLAHHAAHSNRELPALRGARLAPTTGVTLLLDEPAEPIAPFTTGDTARRWNLDPHAELLPTDQLADTEAPYPGLVTLGADDEGLVLIDVMMCGVLLLDGTDEEVLEVARALALELGTCAWTDYSEILTTGLGARLAGLLPQGRIRTMPHLPAVATDLGELMLEAHQSGEQVLPWLAIGAGEVTEEHLVQLADALAAGRILETGVVLPASDAAVRCFPHAEVINVTHGEKAPVGALDTAVELQRITDEQYRQYVHALTVATQDPDPAQPPWDRAEDHSQAAAGKTPLTVHTVTDDALDPGNPFPALLGSGAPAGTEPPYARSAHAGTVEDPGTWPEAGTLTRAGEQPDAGVPAASGTSPLPHQRTTVQAAESDGVRIDVLGPLRIRGGADGAHSPRTTAVAALIHLRPGRITDALCQAMDPVTPWSSRTLHSRLSELRNAIGDHSDGQPLLPRPKSGAGYRFHPAVTSDWEQFRKLATKGLAAGPNGGIEDLEAAMALVRGKPFGGRALPWAEPVVQEILSRITDTAHTLARWHTDGDQPDLDAARRTVQKALEVEETSETLYRDLLTIEWAAGNDAAVRKTVARLQQMARTYDITLDDTTEDTIALVLSGTAPEVRTARV
ncbi:LysM peptidoglycan-binding domain-containing protein [Streptomyces sp. NPDC002073]